MGNIIGLDIGSTTLSGVLLETDGGTMLRSRTRAHCQAITRAAGFEHTQDPEHLFRHVKTMLQDLSDGEKVDAIGLTGQMHGVLYQDETGRAVSPLYTWQDRRGEEAYGGGESYAQWLTRVGGSPVSTGYGTVTHAYNRAQGLVPPEAAKLNTIAGYIGARLTRQLQPPLHSSEAASLGLYDLETLDFDRAALGRAGLESDFFPVSTEGIELLGETREEGLPWNVPVALPIGDNQASFLGAVGDPGDSILLNIGTGSQVSVCLTDAKPAPGLELRPLAQGQVLCCGAALTGGSAYAVLAEFFRQVAEELGRETVNIYAWMNRLAERPLPPGERLRVRTTFAGTRMQADLRGSIEGICMDNLTPAELVSGVLSGMAEELAGLWEQMRGPMDLQRNTLVVSGNAARRNPPLRRVLAQRFDRPVQIPLHDEEAAFGAALYASVAAGHKATLAEASGLVRYQEG